MREIRTARKLVENECRLRNGVTPCAIASSAVDERKCRMAVMTPLTRNFALMLRQATGVLPMQDQMPALVGRDN